MWFHGGQSPKQLHGTDTWELTHPHLYDVQKGEDADEGTNYFRTNDTIAPEHLRLLHQGQTKTAGGPLMFYPAMHGGKHHLTDPISGTARCRGTVEVNRDESPIHVCPDQERIHPIICKRCLSLGRAAHGRGEHVAAAQPLSEYSIKHQQFEDGFHQITAHHPEKGEVGFMGLDPDGTLNLAQVQPSHQRKGLATAMWDHAKSLGINPQHSNVRSREGDAWAKATGDPVPENLSMYDNADPDEDHVENQSYSTAFTAPGYHHPYTKDDMPHALGYERKNDRTAALHDVVQHSTHHLYDSWGKSDEDKAALVEYLKLL